MSKYSSQLRDPRWQRKRLEVFKAACFECQSCGEKEKELHAHHTIYRKGNNPWEYENSEILCICCDCHDLINNQKLAFDECFSSYMQIVAGDASIYGEFIELMHKHARGAF